MRPSLAQWSLHRAIQSGAMQGVAFPSVARREFGVEAVELVSTLLGGFRREVLRELAERARGDGVRVLLIMVDDEGDLCHPRTRVRKKAVSRHLRWVEAAAALGCHAVRVNTGGERSLPARAAGEPPGSPTLEGAVARCAQSCASLADFALPLGISILLENHGGLSANVPAMIEVVRRAGRANVGTLPDFGNFAPGVDRYLAVGAMLPHARAVSAKTYDFDDQGMETSMDFPRLMRLVRDSGYTGYVGIEYEGTRLPEPEGIRRSKALIERTVN